MNEWKFYTTVKSYFKSNNLSMVYHLLSKNDIIRNAIILCVAIDKANINVVKYVCEVLNIDMNNINSQRYWYKPFYYYAFRKYLSSFSDFGGDRSKMRCYYQKKECKIKTHFRILCYFLSSRVVDFEFCHLMDMKKRLEKYTFEVKQCITKRRILERNNICRFINSRLEDKDPCPYRASDCQTCEQVQDLSNLQLKTL